METRQDVLDAIDLLDNSIAALPRNGPDWPMMCAKLGAIQSYVETLDLPEDEEEEDETDDEE